MQSKIIWIFLAFFLLIGLALSFRDYRQWHTLEVGRFGQGSAEEAQLSSAKPLGLIYSAYIGNFRIKPPAGWIATENLDLKNMYRGPKLAKQQLTEVVRFKDPNSEAQMVISAKISTDDLITIVNSMAAGITRDRQYLRTNDLSITVLTWDKPNQVEQKALFLTNGNLVMVDATSSVNAWKTWQRTFEASYLSLTRI